MRTTKTVKRAEAGKKDYQKEHVFKELSALLGQSGVSVRREKLKQGLGWKVISGSCRAQGDSFLFIDRRLPQDEQIAFLLSKLASLKIQIPESALSQLPDFVKNQAMLSAA